MSPFSAGLEHAVVVLAFFRAVGWHEVLSSC
jgi:hypothetical protein